MANLDIPNTITADSFIVASEHVANYAAIETWLNNRNAGTDTWANMKISASASNPVVISSSAALTEVSINNTATDGDSVLSFELSGTAKFTLGVDDGDSDTFKIGTTAIGTSTMLKMDSTGAILKPLQPSFQASAIANTADQTGDGTAFTCEFDAEVFDPNADFNTTTFTFTAPVTGEYQLNVRVGCTGVLTDHVLITCDLVTSNRTYTSYDDSSLAGDRWYDISVLADMDASDTAYVVLTGSSGAKVIDLRNSATSKYNTFSGSLIN